MAAEKGICKAPKIPLGSLGTCPTSSMYFRHPVILDVLGQRDPDASDPHGNVCDGQADHCLVATLRLHVWRRNASLNLESTTDTNDADVGAAERFNQFNSGWFLAPLATGDYPPMMRERVGSRLPNFTDEEAALVKGSYDLIMINHYYSNLITFCDSEHSETNCSSLADGYFADMGVDNTQVHPDSVIGSGSLANPTSCTDHSGFPPSYMSYIRWANAYDTSADMLLTENGWCGNETIDNQDQLWYYRTHLEMVHHAIYEENIPIIGYTAWSLEDNYEWGSYAPRYGLYYVDFPDNIGDKDVYSVPSTYLNRTARTAAKWYAGLATTGCFEAEPEDEKWLSYL